MKLKVTYRKVEEEFVKIGFEGGLSTIVKPTHPIARKAAVGYEVDMEAKASISKPNTEGKQYINLHVYHVNEIRPDVISDKFKDLPDLIIKEDGYEIQTRHLSVVGGTDFVGKI